MFSTVDRTWIRHFAGFSSIFLQADPRLEAAITAVQSQADLGSRPDSSDENLVKAHLYGWASVAGTNGVTIGTAAQNVTFSVPAQRGLITIEATIALQDSFLGASKADGGEVEIDPGRETIRLRLEGRRLAYSMCFVLGMKRPRINVFSPHGIMKSDEDPYPFASDSSPIW